MVAQSKTNNHMSIAQSKTNNHMSIGPMKHTATFNANLVSLGANESTKKGMAVMGCTWEEVLSPATRVCTQGREDA